MQQNWLPGWVSVVLGGISSSIWANTGFQVLFTPPQVLLVIHKVGMCCFHMHWGKGYNPWCFKGCTICDALPCAEVLNKTQTTTKALIHWFVMFAQEATHLKQSTRPYSSRVTWHDDTFAQMHHQIMLSQLLFVRFWKASFSFFLLAFNVCLQQLGSVGNWFSNAKDVKTHIYIYTYVCCILYIYIYYGPRDRYYKYILCILYKCLLYIYDNHILFI